MACTSALAWTSSSATSNKLFCATKWRAENPRYPTATHSASNTKARSQCSPWSWHLRLRWLRQAAQQPPMNCSVQRSEEQWTHPIIHPHTQHATPRHAAGGHPLRGIYVCFGLDKQLSNRQQTLLCSKVKSREPMLSHSLTLSTQQQDTQSVLTLVSASKSVLA